ncbi:DNA alkylation repair protein [Pseudoalteromonas luteoviolacea]|uniref:DNA alkylation repair protein n=1 Tax=Pseudoalteromonas luteoviolacea S4054 TaxID=1129367 RepID=A0A0F6A555_9GAMM|nr:DNA alkylation repair protein [Pseudoalteromonas luteoviolacea]AOT07582.1 hypothetical protein S4054249_06890 [Pseudoalteromonas luteoviolacea]AOT12498.1 hypothetical protein S40542_06890 [Pseudoalteromonas luteoviolacea]AOT17412.1 hypothetical protein S4054_06890 [Pseudoalteromonas luteoviolacea]KKE81320.1 hypothetical protein N479_22555 [Pseudoalteromonas luteoviolacea S4054]KZN70671.1 hypothetical protein N481_20880 [Pseudoalteromonas luteoviolacea S4047-1]
MPEPFKHVFNLELVRLMALHFHRNFSEFSSDGFISHIDNQFDGLEFKQRSQRICEAMIAYLPDDFEAAARIIEQSLGDTIEGDWSLATSNEHGISGWAILPMAQYVAIRGHGHFDRAMGLLKEMTKRNTAEFAIRHFLDADPDRTLSVMKTWTRDENLNVRRLASEGCRPRLPWGLRLKQYVENPEPVISLLELLKDDPSEYVRRSVANNLNDIAKDHPDTVCETAKRWLRQASPERTALVKHACRTLLKNGHTETLLVLGYSEAVLSSAILRVSSPALAFGNHIELTAELSSSSDMAQPLMIDYIVHHQKANGSTSPKVFKWNTQELAPHSTTKIKKKHTIKPITTRTYYPGIHKVELQVNGKVVAQTQFELMM